MALFQPLHLAGQPLSPSPALALTAPRSSYSVAIQIPPAA